VDWSILGREIFGVRLSALLLSGVVLVIVVLAHLGLRWWLHRKAHQDELDAHGARLKAGGLRRRVPEALRQMVPPLAVVIWIHGLRIVCKLLIAEVDKRETALRLGAALDAVYGFALLAAIVWLLARIGRLVEAGMRSVASRSGNTWDDVLLPVVGRATRRLLPLLALVFGAPALALPQPVSNLLASATGLLLIAAVGFVMYQVVDTVATFLLRQHRADTRNNVHARAIQTQVLVLKRVAVTVIVVFTTASMLMVFDSVRQFGASILASAGIAGIIVGLAAQRSIGGVLAGFQIAITQPIRMDDVVVLENEWGRIEEITLTYVVVCLWDERRLMVPISYFIEKPFQSWTRTPAGLVGTVALQVDPRVPLEVVRAELTRILATTPLWDGRVNAVQVTDAKGAMVDIRALASAADAMQVWDLQCEVRERLMTFLRHETEEHAARA
jgi:small-conductance mechanosensitive channel